MLVQLMDELVSTKTNKWPLSIFFGFNQQSSVHYKAERGKGSYPAHQSNTRAVSFMFAANLRRKIIRNVFFLNVN